MTCRTNHSSKKLHAYKTIISITITLTILMSLLNVRTVFGEEIIEPSYDEMIATLEYYAKLKTYDTYLEQHEDSVYPEQTIEIPGTAYHHVEEMEPVVLNNYNGMEGDVLWTDEKGSITYEVMIDEPGLYNISLTGFPVDGKSSAIQRSIFINGELPFRELHNIEFDRIYVNEEDEIRQDNQGHDLKPSQVEAPMWMTSMIGDYQSYYTKPFYIYFHEGLNTITLLSRREPMIISKIVLHQAEKVLPYDAVSETYEALGYEETEGIHLEIEAESADRKSSPMLYPIVDHSSPAVTPYSPRYNRLNTIGGYNWRTAGQWMEWEVEVPEAGLYEIGFNVKQNFVKGSAVSRSLYINGEIPFEEMEAYAFGYEDDWRVDMLGGENPYQFYLEAGTNTIRMEVVLGDLSEVIRATESCVINLNDIYREVLKVTGTSPDRYRDYQMKANIPDLEQSLYEELKRLEWIMTSLESISGDLSDREAGMLTLADQLTELLDDIEKMPRHLNQFKQNISSLGTWITQAIEQPLQLDKLYIQSADQETPKINNGFFSRLWHEIQTLFYSFIIDYNAIGNVAMDNEEAITVWVGTGRDQANVMKSLIDEDFTKETGINVNLMLVDMNTLLPATLSGQGPDVAMQVTNDIPMNYGMRNAVADLSEFDGFDEVIERFYDSAMVPYHFETSYFALPEQQTFNMMFYRKDILEDLDLDIPTTWDDVKVSLAVLSKNQMQFGMLPSGYTVANMPMPPVSEGMYGMFLYQLGGDFYINDNKASGLDTEVGIEAFKEFTEYYTDYGLEREFDIVNRFRTGEMPLIIADYTTYNTLQVSAPEIRGLWGFTGIPGTVLDDGTINNDVPSNGTACIMMENSENKDAAWAFMKWWVSADIQTKYGREMEALMGPAARYPTANIEAFGNLPWPTEDYEALSEQFEVVRGIPQVPGGYFTARHINNAFYATVVGGDITPREALIDYTRYINDEITHKREEFGLETD